ncbi:hypothetical protein HY772_07220, partial [Candidatus Woesearchaeota archaeon]|nr:hypothetical protein [Candidatus Woesearchaeota archaeon]
MAASVGATWATGQMISSFIPPSALPNPTLPPPNGFVVATAKLVHSLSVGLGLLVTKAAVDDTLKKSGAEGWVTVLAEVAATGLLYWFDSTKGKKSASKSKSDKYLASNTKIIVDQLKLAFSVYLVFDVAAQLIKEGADAEMVTGIVTGLAGTVGARYLGQIIGHSIAGIIRAFSDQKLYFTVGGKFIGEGEKAILDEADKANRDFEEHAEYQKAADKELEEVAVCDSKSCVPYLGKVTAAEALASSGVDKVDGAGGELTFTDRRGKELTITYEGIKGVEAGESISRKDVGNYLEVFNRYVPAIKAAQKISDYYGDLWRSVGSGADLSGMNPFSAGFQAVRSMGPAAFVSAGAKLATLLLLEFVTNKSEGKDKEKRYDNLWKLAVGEAVGDIAGAWSADTNAREKEYWWKGGMGSWWAGAGKDKQGDYKDSPWKRVGKAGWGKFLGTEISEAVIKTLVGHYFVQSGYQSE